MKRGEYWGVCVVLLTWAGLAAGATLYVGGGGAYTSIQDAIDAANPGDEIEVAPGTYSGPGVPGDETQDSALIDFKGKAVRLYSRDGAAVTTIDGSGYYHVVKCISGEGADTVLEGFTITHGGRGVPYPRAGGMSNENSSPTVANCLFTENETRSAGAMSNTESSPLVMNCVFVGNRGSAIAGAVCNSFSDPVLINCVFADNTADSGGAMYNNKSNVTLINCLLCGNRAAYDGSAITNWGGNLTIINCTIANNVIGVWFSESGAIHNEEPASCIVTNCVFWDNVPGADHPIRQFSGNPPLVAYSDVQGGWPGEGNIDADPQFADAAGGDYHPAADSPCIDAGTNSPPVGLPPVDIEGNPRMVDGDGDGQAIVDMGVFEAPAVDPVQLLQDLIEVLPHFDHPPSLYESLKSRLESALEILTDADPENDKAAAGVLKVFISKIKAQRGKKIAEPTADMLMGKAQAIIAMLAAQ